MMVFHHAPELSLREYTTNVMGGKYVLRISVIVRGRESATAK